MIYSVFILRVAWEKSNFYSKMNVIWKIGFDNPFMAWEI